MSTYSQPHIRKHQKRDGSWFWQCFLNVTDEKRKYRQVTKLTDIACAPPKPGEDHKSKPSGKGAKQALDFAQTWRDELIAAENIPEPTVPDETVLEFVERYIKSRDVIASTAEGYGYLIPYLESLNKPITELTAQDVEHWKTTITGAQSMINKAFNLLKYSCKWGVLTGYLPTNPCDPVKAPSRKKHFPNPYNLDDLPHLLDLINGLKTRLEFRDACLLALNSGMRRGEICALRWSDIDGYKDGSFVGCIHVNNVISGSTIKPYPKNEHRRVIDINDNIKAILSNRLDSCLEVVNKSDLASCFVFSHPATPSVHPSRDYISKQWSMFADVHDLKGVEGTRLRFHDLRDTFATAALVSGIPVVTVASILGHKNVSTTLQYYAHFIPSKNAEAMNAMNAIISS